MQFLRQSTACVVEIGPFVDPTTGAPVVGVDVDHTDVFLYKAGGAAADKDDATDNAASDARGISQVALNATDTDTLGPLTVATDMSADTGTPCPTKNDFMVVSAYFYDLMFAADAPARGGVLAFGTASAVGADSITLEAGHGLTAAHAGATVRIVSSTNGNKQSRTFDSIAGDVVTVSPAWAVLPTGTIKYVVEAQAPATTQMEARLAELDAGALPTDVASVAGTMALEVSLQSVIATLSNPAGFKKNTAVTDFSFPMRDEQGNLVTGLTVSGQVQKDGGAFAVLTSAIAEVGATGVYQCTDNPALTAAELNADQVVLLFTAAGAKPTMVQLYTEP